MAISLKASYSGSAAFQKLRADASDAELSTNKLIARQNAIKQTMQGVGVIAGITGAAMIDWAKNGMTQAGEYSAKLLELQQSAGATRQEMDLLTSSILKANIATGQTLNQTTAEYVAAIQHGLTATQLLQRNPKTGQDVGQTLAEFAHVQQYYHGVDPSASVTGAVQLAHLEGTYDPAGIQRITEAVNKLTFTSGAAMNQILTQGSYFIPVARRLGLSVDQTMAVLGEFSITGLLRGKGGAGVADLLMGFIKQPKVTGSLSGKADIARYELGIVDKAGRNRFQRPDGTIDYDKTMAQMNADAITMNRAQFIKDATIVGGVPGGRVATLMTNPAAVAQEKTLAAQRKYIADIHTMVEATYDTWKGATSLLASNLNTFQTLFFVPLTKSLGPVIHSIADLVGAASVWANAHPDMVFKASIATLAIGFRLMIFGAKSVLAPFLDVAAGLKALGATATLEAAELRAAAVGGGVPVVGAAKGATAATVAEASSVAKVGGLARFGKIVGGVADLALNVLTLGLITKVSSIGAAFRWIPVVAGEAGMFGNILRVLTGPIGLAVGAVTFLYEAVKHPIGTGKLLADVQIFFTRTLPTEVHRGWDALFHTVSSYLNGTGKSLITTAFHGIIAEMLSIVNNAAGTIGQVMGDLSSLNLGKAISDAKSGVADEATLLQRLRKSVNDQQYDNDRVNKRLSDSYKHELDIDARHRTGGYKNASALHGGAGHTTNIHVKVEGATGADHAALAKKIAGHVSQVQEKQAARGVAAHGGLGTSPLRPQIAN